MKKITPVKLIETTAELTLSTAAEEEEIMLDKKPSLTEQVSELSNLINVRNYLEAIVNNLRVKLSREELRSVQDKVSQFDKYIVLKSIELKLN